MFGWLQRRKRQIFKYWDGTRTRHADPLILQTKLFAHEDYQPEKFKLVDKPDEFGDRARAQAFKVLQDVFGFPPLADDGKSGLTMDEAFSLFESFCVYLDGLKKNIEVSQSTAGPMESTAEG